MSRNSELDRVEREANEAGFELERAFDRVRDALMHDLRPELEKYVRGRVGGIGRELNGALDEYAELAQDRGTRVIGSLREAAERELQVMEEKPLGAWGIVVLSGVFLGYLLGRNRLESRSGERIGIRSDDRVA